MTRIVVLVDGIHTRELIAAIGRLMPMDDVELILVYVHGSETRAGLEMFRRRPGRGPTMPPHRERAIGDAERLRGADALTEAERLARTEGASARTVEVAGEAGREVCGIANRERADLIAVRAHGPDRPPAGPRSLGPAARFIADHAPCSVLLVTGAP